MRLDPQAVPVELERLALSFNHMLERIEDVFTRQSNFSADIAHEIRTPITNLVTQTEIALSQSRSQQELEEVLYSNLEEFSRMSRMVSDMLFLAQADNNQLIPEQQALDLADEVHKVFEFFEAWAEEKAVALRFVGSSLPGDGRSADAAAGNQQPAVECDPLYAGRAGGDHPVERKRGDGTPDGGEPRYADCR